MKCAKRSTCSAHNGHQHRRGDKRDGMGFAMIAIPMRIVNADCKCGLQMPILAPYADSRAICCYFNFESLSRSANGCSLLAFANLKSVMKTQKQVRDPSKEPGKKKRRPTTVWKAKLRTTHTRASSHSHLDSPLPMFSQDLCLRDERGQGNIHLVSLDGPIFHRLPVPVAED